MAIQLKPDEMLDFLRWAGHSSYPLLKQMVENQADILAAAVAETFPELTVRDSASFEGTAFAGTCVPFEPTVRGPVPEVLQFFAVEVQEWKDMCDELSD